MLIEFYCDGSCTFNGREGATMGAGIVGVCEGRRKEWAFYLGPGTNNRAELLAIQQALLVLEERGRYDVVIYSDSEWAIKCLDGTWHPLKNLDLIIPIKVLMQECKSFRLQKVKGHAGHPENCRADQIAGAAARGEEVNLIDVASQRYVFKQGSGS